ncbi:unnamed protein product [Prunus armeniaca]
MEKVKLHTPDMVMLLETKTRSSRYVFSKEGTRNAIYACDGDRAEKQGGNSRSERSMLDFQSFVTDLSDLGFVGYPFTWRNRQQEEGIQEWLDRGFADDNWLRF